MNRSVNPGPLAGTIPAVASKSEAHRLLVCAAFAGGTTNIDCATTSADIDATIRCLEALGARIARTRGGFRVVPVSEPAANAILDCGESGSTLRFLLPVAAALGTGAWFVGHGRLPERPLSPLYEELIAGGAELSPQGTSPLEVTGKLRPGRFELPGNVSSQYVTGLLLAAPLMGGPVEIQVTEPIESSPYIAITIDALAKYGVEVAEEKALLAGGESAKSFIVAGSDGYTTPGSVTVGGDWSNAAFWLAAGALSDEGVRVTGLDPASAQGDRAILAALALLGARVERKPDGAFVRKDVLRGATIDVKSCPDLVPPIAAVAACAAGTTRITGAARLRLKESDRLATVSAAINAVGGRAEATDDGLLIEGAPELAGGTVDAANDHRIAMMAAVMAANCAAPVEIRGADCVAKSYPAFFEDLATLQKSVAGRR